MSSDASDENVHDLNKGRNAPDAEAHIPKDDSVFEEAHDHKDGDALEESSLQLNPEVMRGVPPLPDLNQVEVVLVRPASRLGKRWAEGIGIHVVGSGIVAVVAFVAGLMLAGASNKAESLLEVPGICETTSASAAQCYIAE
jgi:hypothetical protein